MAKKTGGMPETEILKKRIREEIRESPPGAEQPDAAAGADYAYHNLLMRIKQQGLRGRIKRLVFHVTRFITLWQEQFNEHIQQATEGLSRSTAQLFKRQQSTEKDISAIRSQTAVIENSLYEVRTRTDALESRLDSTDAHIQALQAQTKTDMEALQSAVSDEFKASRREMFEVQRMMRRFLEAAGPESGRSSERPDIAPLAEAAGHFPDSLYLAFEDRFRGAREAIQARLSVYLPVIADRFAPAGISALDIGSGRGEWLQFLEENGIRVKGVDINRMAVSQCREFGLDAVEADALAFLKASPEASFHVISAFHFIEHIAFEQLMELLDEIYRVLTPGGLVLFETPNPTNILVGACDFHRDPSHLKPVHPDTARFMLEYRGFEHTRLRLVEQEGSHCRLLDYNDWPFDVIDHYITIPRDYALISQKPGPPAGSGNGSAEPETSPLPTE